MKSIDVALKWKARISLCKFDLNLRFCVVLLHNAYLKRMCYFYAISAICLSSLQERQHNGSTKSFCGGVSTYL